MNQLLIATKNLGKIREIKEILHNVPFVLKTLDEIGFTEEIPENGKTFKENAIQKAGFVGKKTNLLTLAEDSGLEVEALNGKPGIFSARYCEGTDMDRINKLLKEMRGISKEKRKARFQAVAAIFDPTTKKIFIFEGISNGYITDEPKGLNGFGYDPIFFNLETGKTNGEATFEEKNRVSHRAKALFEAKKFLIEQV